ncbi:hypothetical protein Nepgr_001404 [Nepenthes gracilis]|uniref:Uncharacterized protein n=1 Tax=Nepenthes gracilis TaxID=150966 RepID=A0AAD3P2N2_NEPGR|nr:hypothetical protein Nepgr_001404 [Nepenthes gracilis]
MGRRLYSRYPRVPTHCFTSRGVVNHAHAPPATRRIPERHVTSRPTATWPPQARPAALTHLTRRRTRHSERATWRGSRWSPSVGAVGRGEKLQQLAFTPINAHPK